MADTVEQKVRSIKLAIWILGGLVIASVLIFHQIGHERRSWFDSLWMTLQVLTTVGDTGFERSQGEKVWSAILMAVGVFMAFYLGINVTAFVVDGELRQLFGRRRLESRIKKMQGHFVICGFGRMGRALAEAFDKKGAPFVVIDRDEKAMLEAAECGYLHLRGDAMSEVDLETVQVGAAAGLATCLPEDADNVFVTLTARELNQKMRIVAKANYDEAHAKLRRAGADEVLSPSKLAADRALTKFMLPAVDELLEIVVHGADLEVSKISLERLPQAVNHALRDLAVPSKTGLMVMAVIHEDGRRSFNPSPDIVLRESDELIVIGQQGGVTKMVDHFG